jgi:hypothetical protein
MKLRDILPREHGTWAMMLVPWIVGCGVARSFALREIVLLVATLAFFLAETQARAWLKLGLTARPDTAAIAAVRIRTLGLAIAGALAGLALLVVWRRDALLLFAVAGGILAAISLALVRHKRDRGIGGQVLAVAGFSLTAPLAYYVGRGRLDDAALELWLLNALFFLAAVSYVQLKIEALKRRGGLASLGVRVRVAGAALGLHAAVLAALGVSVALGPLSPAVALAFLPFTLQVGVGVARLDRPVRLKRLGVLSTFHSAVFALLVIGLV